MKDYWVEKRELKRIDKSFQLTYTYEYNVVCSKVLGLAGLGTRVVAVFKDDKEANRYADELNYIQEQRRKEYEKEKEKKQPARVNGRTWENHVAECYNDWNVAHGYKYQ